MERKFYKDYHSKNKKEKYFHREFTQTYKSRRKTVITPDFRRKNNTKKYSQKINNIERKEKYNMRYFDSKWEWFNEITLLFINITILLIIRLSKKNLGYFVYK